MSGHDYFDCVPLVFFLASASSKMAARKREGAWAGREGAWVKWVVGGAQPETPPQCVRQCTSSTWCSLRVCVCTFLFL